MNVVVKGATKQILDEMLKKGYASTNSEAIRLALFWFDKSQLAQDERAAKKIEKIHKRIKEGKEKTISLDEMAKEFPEFRGLKSVSDKISQ